MVMMMMMMMMMYHDVVLRHRHSYLVETLRFAVQYVANLRFFA